MTMKKKWQAKVLKGLAWFGGSLLTVLVVLEILLSPAVATRIVNKYAPRLMDADLSFGKAGVSVLLHFPNLSVKVSDAVLTYPHDRFAEFEDSTALMMEGRAEESDTLACFDRFTATLSVPALIAGTVRVNRLDLEHPRIFAKQYNDSTANWNIFASSSEEKSDTSSSSLRIKLRKLKLSDDARIVLCMPEDSIAATLDLELMELRGKVATDNLLSSRGDFKVQKLAAAAFLKEDSYRFELDKMDLHGNRKNFSLDAEALVHARFRGCDSIAVPVSLEARASLPEDSIVVVKARKLKARVAGIPLEARGDAVLHSDRISVDAEASMVPIRIGEMLRDYGPAFWKEAGRIESDATLYLEASARGDYIPSSGEIPEIHAVITVPPSVLKYKGVDQALSLNMLAKADGGAGEDLDLFLDTLSVKTDGLDFGASGRVRDLVGEDPDIRLGARLSADIAKAMGILPESLGILADGNLDASLDAKARLSQLNMNRIGDADITGRLICDTLGVTIPSDTLSAFLRGVRVELGSSANRYDDSMDPDARVLMLSAAVDTLDAEYKGMYARAGRLFAGAQNSADILDDMELSLNNVKPFAGYLDIGSISLRDVDSSMVALRGGKEFFTVRPKNGNGNIPVLHLSSNNARVALRSGVNRVFVRDLGLDITAAMNTYEKKARMAALRDSLSKVYPDVPRDSVVRYAFRKKRAERVVELPEWLQEDDFKKGDINLALSGALAKYFNEWDLDGTLTLASGALATPYFPLRNRLSNARINVTNDRLSVRSMTLRSGESDISLSGGVTNLKRVLRGRGVLGLDLRVTSDHINANELLAALDAGQKVNEAELRMASNLSDEEYEGAVASAELPDSAALSSLIIVPANVNAELFIDANNIEYSTLIFDWVQAEAVMKERCLQLTNVIAMSNMGNIFCEAFYSTKTKKNIKAGVTVDLEDITAERVIELLPSVDSLMPVIKSFSGLLNCSFAVTTSLDEKMNVILPTVNGVVRISGRDLLVDDMGDFKKITRLLMFKNKNQVYVDNLEVNGLIQDNRLEVFPFILDVDRYKLALSGTQNLDQTFRYHVSVMKWPLLFKFGIDLSGDFDKFKFHLGKAKYRKEKKVPVFTKVVDESKANLKDIIHNIFRRGIDKAVAEFDSQKEIQAYKDSLAYVPAEQMPLDTLGGKDMKLLEKGEEINEIVSLDTADLEQLDSLKLAKLDSLGVSLEDLKKLQKELKED